MMKKNPASLRISGTYTAPGTPEYDNNNGGQIHTSIRRQVSGAALMPFSSGKAVPSKWDDAERWITSPVSPYIGSKHLTSQTLRQQKSKSGPLGAAGHVQSESVSSSMSSSVLTTGVMVPELRIKYGAGPAGNTPRASSVDDENSMARSTSLPGFSNTISESPKLISQDDKPDDIKEEQPAISPAISRRDMATQMSPGSSSHSSSRGSVSFSTFPSSIHTPAEPHSDRSARDEVQVDKDANMSRLSKKHELRKMMKDSPNARDLPSTQNAPQASRSMSKLQRDEAKITEWENLQKAKAEAAIKKLEMKLEKKREASMKKISNRLRAVQAKAEAMRNAISENDAHRASRKIVYSSKSVKMSCLGNHFCCHTN